MTRITLGVVAAALVGLNVTGCESVKTAEPIGQRIEASLDDWSGTWQFDEHIVFLKGGDGGTLHIAAVDWQEDAFQLIQIKGFVTSLGENRFLHLPEEEESPGGDGAVGEETEAIGTRYSFLLVERSDSSELVFSGVNVQAFRLAVEKGELIGDVQVDRVAVGDDGVERAMVTHVMLRDKAAMDAYLARTPLDKVFQRAEPVRLRRITGEKPGETNETPREPPAERE